MTAKTTPPSGDAQKPWGGHPSCDPAPLTTSFGTVGQWERRHRAMVERTKGRRPKNRPCVTQGRRPKNRPAKGGTLKATWVSRGRVPRTLASWRHLLLQVVAATTGGTGRAPPDGVLSRRHRLRVDGLLHLLPVGHGVIVLVSMSTSSRKTSMRKSQTCTFLHFPVVRNSPSSPISSLLWFRLPRWSVVF